MQDEMKQQIAEDCQISAESLGTFVSWWKDILNLQYIWNYLNIKLLTKPIG